MVYAENEDGVSAADIFKIGASITLDVTEGPVGTVVEVDGKGFTENGIITSIRLMASHAASWTTTT